MQLWHNIDTHRSPNSLVNTQDYKLYSKLFDNKRHEQLSIDLHITTMGGLISHLVKVASNSPIQNQAVHQNYTF